MQLLFLIKEKMSKLSQLQGRIYELVPRLKELSFGCEVEMFEIDGTDVSKTVEIGMGTVLGKSLRIGEYIILNIQKPFIDSHSGKFNNDQIESWREGSLRVIGHPITLEDVLEALNNTEHYCYGYHYDEGFIITDGGGEYYKDGDFYWESGKPLSDQSQETIAFLHSLLIDNQ